jgi:hypothetical protein
MRSRVAMAFVTGGLAAASLVSSLPAAAAQPGVKEPTLTVVGYGAEQHPHGNGSTSPIGAPKSSHCIVLVGDDDGSYPGPLLVEPGAEELRIDLHTSVEPVRHSLAVYARPLRADPSQRPVHPGSSLVRTAHHGWQVRSALHLAAGQQAYLDLQVSWKDTSCGGRDEHGYAFHIRGAN